MKTSNTTRAVISYSLGILLALLFFINQAEAQCPSDIHPVSGESGYVDWSGPFTQTGLTITGTSCTVDFIFCSRFVNGVHQFYIKEIDPTSSGCDGVTWSYIMNDIREHFFINLSSDFCGNGHVVTVATVFMASCAEMVKCSGCTTAVCKFCPGAYCAKTCNVCIDPVTNQHVESSCTFTQIGTADCTAAPDGWPNASVAAVNSWSTDYFDHCYLGQSCGN